jgi:hypothetical protein
MLWPADQPHPGTALINSPLAKGHGGVFFFFPPTHQNLCTRAKASGRLFLICNSDYACVVRSLGVQKIAKPVVN